MAENGPIYVEVKGFQTNRIILQSCAIEPDLALSVERSHCAVAVGRQVGPQCFVSKPKDYCSICHFCRICFSVQNSKVVSEHVLGTGVS